MIQRSFLKPGYAAAFLLVAVGLFYLACETQRPTSSEMASPIAEVVKGKTYSVETIKPELKKLLTFLKTNPQIITPAVLAKAAERHATIADIGLSGKFPAEFPLEDGNMFEVYIELFNGSVGSGTSIEDADVYFTLDIDRYPEEAGVVDRDNFHDFVAHVAATAHNKQRGLYQDSNSQQKLTLESNTQEVNYFLFFVGGEERLSKANQERLYQQWLNGRPGLAKAQADPSTEYWWIMKIKVDKKKDSSGEEFELYYGPDGYDGVSHPFNSSALFLFNGTYQNDASGISRQCPDINGTGVFTMPHPIAVEVLTPDSPAGFKICPIEEDCTPGYHKNGGQGTYSFNMNIEDIDVMTWFNRTYGFSVIDDCGDDDDIYNNSGTVSFGASPWQCVYSYPSAPFVRLCLRRGRVGQADSSWGGPCASGYPCPW